MPPSVSLLFAYGTLRRGRDNPMARLVSSRSQWVGSGRARGALYHLDGGYPGFVPDAMGGPVLGDLFAMNDPDNLLSILDDYEECATHFPEPHEYRRGIITVEMATGVLEAWTYIYAWPVRPADVIATGDFLS